MIYYCDEEIKIRDLQEKDVVNLFSWWIDKEINQYDPRAIPQNSKQLIEECIRYSNIFDLEKMNSNDEARKYRYFIITDAEQKPIGFVNFFSIDKDRKQGEIGIIIGDKRYWKKGIGFKAVNVVANYIFENMKIDRIVIETGETNEPALKLFRKLNFVVSGENIEDDGFRFIVMEKTRVSAKREWL
ncbi:MAG: GNAT family N-acetyltransferase [Clostridiales bacterium GWB2_37_7]|nr:MAG: GNAT family N-acetyltransferase [Clostridiales bacterium GWB2_37_7]